PIFCAAHRPSSLLRRAVALNRSSSSWANCFSKPSSRLSNVVIASLAHRQRSRSHRFPTFPPARHAASHSAVSTTEVETCQPPFLGGLDRQGNRGRTDSQ